MALIDCLTKAGYTKEEIDSLTKRANDSKHKGESVEDSFKRLIPVLEQEHLSELNSIKEQLGIPITSAAPVKDVGVSLEDFRSPDRIADALQKPNYAILTATQESLGPYSSEDNVRNNEELRNSLIKEFGEENVQQIGGRYKGVEQGPSFIVTNIDEGRAREIGMKYNQESIITNKGNVMSDTGDYNPNRGNTLVGEEAFQSEFQSVITGPDGNPVSFSMDIDWGQTIPSGATRLSARRGDTPSSLSDRTAAFFSSFDDIINPNLQSVQSELGTNPTEEELLQARNRMMESDDEATRDAATRLPTKPAEFVTDVTAEDRKIERDFNRYKSSFGLHIEASIPTFKDSQVKKIKAISKMLEDGYVVYDLGGSEGSFIKAIANNTNADVDLINLDASKSMENNFNATPVEQTRFVAESFGEGFTDGNVEYKAHKPSKKADVVHESMLFQFISPDRASQVQEIKNNYMKDDGVLIMEEKLFNKNWEANEIKKNKDWKSKHFSQSDIALKEQQVGVTGERIVESVDSTGQTIQSPERVVGMNSGVISDNELAAILRDNFEHVQEYWDAGNFKGYVASNSKAKIDQFMANLGGEITSEFSNPETEQTNLSLDDINRQMSDSLETLQNAINQAVDEVGGKLRGAEATKFYGLVDNNKFMKAIDEVVGNPNNTAHQKKRARQLSDLAESGLRIPKSIKNTVERTLGMPVKEFLDNATRLNEQRKALSSVNLKQNKKNGVQKTKNDQGRKSNKVSERGPGQAGQNSPVINQSSLKPINEVLREIRNEVIGREGLAAKLMGTTTVNAVVEEAAERHITTDGTYSKEAMIADQVIRGNKIPDAAEEVAMGYALFRMKQIRDARNDTYEKAKAQDHPDAGKYLQDLQHAEDNVTFYAEAMEIAGSKTGLALRIRRHIITEDLLSESSILKRMRKTLPKGTTITERYRALAKRYSTLMKKKNDQIRELRSQKDRVGAELKEGIAESEIQNLKDSRGKSSKGKVRRVKSLADARSQLNDVLSGKIC